MTRRALIIMTKYPFPVATKTHLRPHLLATQAAPAAYPLGAFEHLDDDSVKAVSEQELWSNPEAAPHTRTFLRAIDLQPYRQG